MQKIITITNEQEYWDFIFGILQNVMLKYPNKTFMISTRAFSLRAWRYACVIGFN